MTVRCPKCRRKAKVKTCPNCGKSQLMVLGRGRPIVLSLKRAIGIRSALTPVERPHIQCRWCGWVAYSVECSKCQTAIELARTAGRG